MPVGKICFAVSKLPGGADLTSNMYIKGVACNVGKELLNDALLLHEAGFTPEQCVVNVIGVAVSNSYSSPNIEALASQEAASPALLLAKEV